jgi:hypothetical protein
LHLLALPLRKTLHIDAGFGHKCFAQTWPNVWVRSEEYIHTMCANDEWPGVNQQQLHWYPFHLLDWGLLVAKFHLGNV